MPPQFHAEAKQQKLEAQAVVRSRERRSNAAGPMSYKDRITLEPGKRGGKPCIRGLRITVYDVLSYLASGMTYEEILADFPYLEREDILASVKHAAEWERVTRAASG